VGGKEGATGVHFRAQPAIGQVLIAEGLVVLLYVALGVALFWRVWSSHAATNMQLGGDDWRNVWFLGWTPWAILHGHNPLYSAAANYPGGVNVLLNAGTPFLGIVFSPVTLLFGPIATFNVASTLALPLSAIAAYALIRRFTTWRPAAFAGGLLYGFGPPLMVHGLEGHLNLAFAALVPLIFLALHELIVRQKGSVRWWGVCLGLLVAAQFFTSTEVLLETVVVAGIAIAVSAAFGGYRNVRARAAYAVKGLLWAGAVATLLLAWPVWIMVRGPGHVSGPVQLVAQGYRADLLSPFVPDSAQMVVLQHFRSMADHFSGNTAENVSYLGLPLLVLLAVGLIWRRRHPAVLVACITAVTAFVLSLGAALSLRSAPAVSGSGAAIGHVPLPEAVLYKVPLLENLIPARFALQVCLCLAVAGGILLQELHDHLRASKLPRWCTAAIPAVIAAVTLVPLLPAGAVQGVGPSGAPPGFTAVARSLPQGTVAVVFPFPSANFSVPVLWQVRAKFRFSMPGGSFFVPQPPSGHVAFSQLLGYTYDSLTAETLTNLQEGRAPPEIAALRTALLAEWKSWHISAVMAVPAATSNPAASTLFFDWLLGPPTARAESTVAWSRLPYP
jgi:hypothetical protein